MKEKILFFVFVFVFISGCSNQPVTITQQENQEHTIQVQSEGKVETTPDVAHLTIKVEVDHQQAEKAQKIAKEKMEKVYQKLDDLGIKENNIETLNFNVHMNRDYSNNDKEDRERKGSSNPIVGYTVSNTINVDVNNTDQVGTILDELTSVENVVAPNVSFGLLSEEEAKNQAIKSAAKKAKKRAELIAEELELNIIDIKEVAVNRSSSSNYPSYNRLEHHDAAKASTPISPQNIVTMASVDVTFIVN